MRNDADSMPSSTEANRVLAGGTIAGSMRTLDPITWMTQTVCRRRLGKSGRAIQENSELAATKT
jgi:hypothetical protein